MVEDPMKVECAAIPSFLHPGPEEGSLAMTRHRPSIIAEILVVLLSGGRIRSWMLSLGSGSRAGAGHGELLWM